MALDKLKPAEYNPRKISDAALKGLEKSIERFGLVEPIIWNKTTGNVVGGHQRLKVLQLQGVKQTDVLVVTLNKKEEKALNLTLNNPNINGIFDNSLDDILSELKINFTGLEETMFEDLRLNELFSEDTVEESNEITFTKTTVKNIYDIIEGDTFTLGNHKIVCGKSNNNYEDITYIISKWEKYSKQGAVKVEQ